MESRLYAIGFTTISALIRTLFATLTISRWKTPNNVLAETEEPPRLKRKAEMIFLPKRKTYNVTIHNTGGGVAGAGRALAAPRKRLNKASSHPTKLTVNDGRDLHSAKPTLDVTQYRTAREALNEKLLILQLDSNLTHPMPIIHRLHKLLQIPFFWFGLKCYILLDGLRSAKNSDAVVSRKYDLELLPKLKNVVLVYQHANHVDVKDLIKTNNSSLKLALCGVKVKDNISNKEFTVKAICIINAAGPFTDSIRKMDDPSIKTISCPSAGAHIERPGNNSRDQMSLFDPSISDGRAYMSLSVALSAAHHYETVGNQVRALIKTNDATGKQMLCVAMVKNNISDKEFTVKRKCTINASGQFTDSTLKMYDRKVKSICYLRAGTHIVLSGYYSPYQMDLLHVSASDGRAQKSYYRTYPNQMSLFDLSISDGCARMCSTVARTAARIYLTIYNQVEVKNIIKTNDSSDKQVFNGARLKNNMDEEEFTVKAKCIINGIWPIIDSIRKMVKNICYPSADADIELHGYYIPDEMGLLNAFTSNGGSRVCNFSSDQISLFNPSTSDAHLFPPFAVTASSHFTTVCNHVEPKDPIKPNFAFGKQVLCGTKIKNNMSDKEFTVKPNYVIHATWPFTDYSRKMIYSMCYPSAGTDIVLPGYYSPDQMGFWDATTSDGGTRMCSPVDLTTYRHYAAVCNQDEVRDLIKINDAFGNQVLCVARVKHNINDKKFTVKPTCNINATGPFTKSIRNSPKQFPIYDLSNKSNFCRSEGTHIGLPGYLPRDITHSPKPTKSKMQSILNNIKNYFNKNITDWYVLTGYYSPYQMGLFDSSISDKRTIFFLPCQRQTIAGTTDLPCEITHNPKPTEGKFQFILNGIKNYFNKNIGVRSRDVLSASCGIRPFVSYPKEDNTRSLVRYHIIPDLPRKMTCSPKPTECTIEYMLNDIKNYFSNGIEVRPSNVLSAWCGIRPFVSNPNKKDTRSLARNDIIHVSPSNLATITGGKWTLHRVMAEHIIDAFINACNFKQQNTQTVTSLVKIKGGHACRPKMYSGLVKDFGLKCEVNQQLAKPYGNRALSVAKIESCTGKPCLIFGFRIPPLFPYIIDEILYGVREYGCNAVIAHGLHLPFLNVPAAQEALPIIVNNVDEELKRSKNDKERQMGLMLNQEKIPIKLSKKEIQTNSKRLQFDHEIEDYVSINEFLRVLKSNGDRNDSGKQWSNIVREIDTNMNSRLEAYLELMSANKTGGISYSRFDRMAEMMEEQIEKSTAIKSKFKVFHFGDTLLS